MFWDIVTAKSPYFRSKVYLLMTLNLGELAFIIRLKLSNKTKRNGNSPLIAKSKIIPSMSACVNLFCMMLVMLLCIPTPGKLEKYAWPRWELNLFLFLLVVYVID